MSKRIQLLMTVEVTEGVEKPALKALAEQYALQACVLSVVWFKSRLGVKNGDIDVAVKVIDETKKTAEGA